MNTTSSSVGTFRDMPIGIDADSHRTESDSMGEIDGTTLNEATLDLGYMDEDRFDEVADPKRMTGSGVAGA